MNQGRVSQKLSHLTGDIFRVLYFAEKPGLSISEEVDNAFVVGVFSLLDVMLGIPMDKALSSIALPQTVQDALLHKTGVYAPFLELVLACENGDDEGFARTSKALHLSNHQVNWAHLQALAWADNLAEDVG